MLIKFDDMVKNPQKCSDEMAEFVGAGKTTFLEPPAANTSFK
jgi:hypothetical protein